MKFGAQYEKALRQEDYPPTWIESSISYKKLKKCIKKVQKELLELGLDRETLNALWQHVGETQIAATKGDNPDRMMHYQFSPESDVTFVPKLTIALDPVDGSPMDAWLSPDTKKILRQVGKRKQSSVNGVNGHGSGTGSPERDNGERKNSTVSQAVENQLDVSTNNDRDYEDEGIETVEVPLTADSEFFITLKKELNSLDKLEEFEQKDIQAEIDRLSEDLRVMKASKRKDSKAQLKAWQEVFRLYNDAEVFMSSHEADAGVRSASAASKQMQWFTKELSKQMTNNTKLSKDANTALERFVNININLLRLLKFHEINSTAFTKIMKKFDKRTALHAQTQVMQKLNERPVMTKELARRTCYTISDELIKLIPQLDDYLCPVCFSISWRPVRLRCGHLFCIRCLIVLQRSDKDECPMCREKVVMDANTDNIDKDLVKFMKENFKDEVKVKQKENEFAAGVDRFGETYDGNHKCSVM